MPPADPKSPASRKKSASQQKRKPTVSSGKAASATGKPDIRIFVSYSHTDTASMERLRTHLAALMRDGVSVWFDGDLDAGDELKTGIARALRQAQIFVALLSPDYLASNYCWNIEYRRAMNRRARGSMRVVAAVVRPCDWKSTRAAGFKLLPRDGRPVTRWRSADEAFLDIAEGIKGVVGTLRKEMSAPRPAPPKPAPPKKRAALDQVPASANAARRSPRPKPGTKPGTKAPPSRRAPSK